jgi:hypothetical protein
MAELIIHANSEHPAGVPVAPTESVEGEAVAWEQIESGRFMPRRIKGSCKGRALG